MSKIKIVGHASGSGVLTIAAPNTNTDRTITIPDVTGTLLDSGSDLPAANLTGTIAIARIADDAVTAAKLANSINTDIATGVTGNTTANAALPKAGGAMTGTITGFTSTGVDDNAGGTVITIDSSSNVGIRTTAPAARLHIQGGGTFNHTPGQNTTSDFIITSSEMGDNNAHSIMQLVSVRQSLSTGSGSTGYLGFTTMDDSNAQGIRDAGRIAIVNEVGASRNSPTALSFWANVGGADTTVASERMRISSNGTINTGNHAVFSGNLSSGVNTVKITTPQALSPGNHWDQFTAIFTMSGVDGGLSGNTFTQWRQTYTGLSTWGGGTPVAIIGTAPSVTHAPVSIDYVQFDIATGYIPGNTILRVEVLSHSMRDDCVVTIT